MSAPATHPRISPRALHERLAHGQAEIAVLDVREQGLFTRKSLLWAASAPHWRLELSVARLVPRLTTPIVLVDLDGSGVQASAERLSRLGYSDVSVLDGGVLAWEAAGLEVFQDESVPGKAFGEWVEHQAGTPHIDVETLRRKVSDGENLVIVDGRTADEFKAFSIPGAFNLPNMELPYRIRELAPDPATLVVVHCAGRTRSIIGAQTLIDAGIPNPVVALENGTMDWLLQGHPLAQGRATALPEPAPANLAAAQAGAAALSRRLGVRTVDAAELQRFAADTTRTLYRFDVRTEAEYLAGHLPGWRWAPGGQLVQGTDKYAATRGSRIVLADWDGVRAPATAAWLAQIGAHEVYLHVPPAATALEVGAAPERLLPDPLVPEAAWIDPQQAQADRQQGRAVIVDVDNSLLFRKAHPEGAWFAAPHRLPALAAERFAGRSLIVTSRDGVLARRVAGELRRQGLEAAALLGGNAAWAKAGLRADAGDEQVLTGEEDTRHGPYTFKEEAVRHARFRAYLAWELGLVAQLQRPGAETRYTRALP